MLEPGKTKRKIVDNRPQKKSFNFARSFYYLLLIAFICALVYVFFFSPYLRVTNIDINGCEKIQNDMIKAKLDDALSGKYLGAINRNNLILLRTGKFSQDLRQNFKLIRIIDIKRKFPSGIEINIQERKLQLLVCSSGNCYFVDDKGEFFPKDNFAPEGINPDDFWVLNDFGNIAVDLKHDIFERSYVDFIFSIKDQLQNEFQIELEKNMETPSRVSSDLRMTTTEGWKIFLNRDLGADKEINMLRIIFNEKVDKDKRKDLEYVDLRANNKVYYKFKDGTQQQEEAKAEEEKKK